ncbi:hypothetical protein IC757_09660 [Wenzhouxiangella sp. AB-CW3]|uniref:M12 family metallo-peptidase n=1 Tax=Wenzhouxiangella sp. AB-CW3 TaxID=2771012 RepID=UPI00168BF7F5|nr:M12 family metallo-peptidase [Wenzhouxiangella sp. AB-CW3]QOC21321.1 hypothetical protein IC757_09660 [Wenzhouxiangella sp. AB-CW3]
MAVESENSDRANELRRFLGDETVQSWTVNLDLDALTAIEGPNGTRIATDRGAPLSGQRLALPVPKRSTPLQLKIDTVHEGKDGMITYAGKIDGDDGSLVAITVDQEALLGRIHHSEGFTYLLESRLDSPQYTLSIIDQTLIPRPEKKHHNHLSPQNVEQEQKQAPTRRDQSAQPMSSGGEVRVLVMYTPAVAQQENIALMANNIIATFNQSLSYSGVNSSNFVTLAGLRNINDNLSTSGHRCRDEILFDKSNEEEAFSNISDWMSEDWADMGLTIMTTETGYTECSPWYSRAYGGAAFFIPESAYPEHPFPYANTTHTFAMADLTAIHEIGHVLNGRHEDCGGSPQPTFACGYAPSHCDWQTIMGGYVNCDFEENDPPDQQPTVRIARWSNPDVNYIGEKTGETSRNMAAALDTNMPYAAGWKGPQPTPPQPPNPVSIQPEFCWGMNTLQWTAQPDATEYRVFQTNSSVPVYSGPGTQTLVNYSSPTTLVVRACNAGGCSADSQQVTTTYYAGCL